MSRLLPLLLLLALSANLDAVKICRESQALLFPGNNICYLLKGNSQSYSIAMSQCIAISDGNLVSITTEEEDKFIRQNFTGEFPFWIGLSDSSTEDEFRWEETDELHLPSHYDNWKTDWMSDNSPQKDCVFYNMEEDWEIQHCSFDYPYLCKFESCDSNDGVYCIGEAPTTAPAAFDIVPVVAVLIILVIIVVIVVIVILVLFYLYKKQNDVWKRLCSCITFKQTKQQVHGLEQENFRLRKELGNLKHTSINLSGSQSHSFNRPRVISSIPDGQGGMLPSIRPVIPSPNAHPPIPVSPTGDPSKPGPPPLAQNTSLLQSSMNYSIRSQIVPTPLPQPNMNSSITSDQIAGILWSQKADFQVPKKPAMNSGQQRVPSRSLFQSPYPTTSTPFTFPNAGNLIASPLPDQTRTNPSETQQKNTTQDNLKKSTEKDESKNETEQEVPTAGEEKIPQEDKQ